jgi:hypothetical protein
MTLQEHGQDLKRLLLNLDPDAKLAQLACFEIGFKDSKANQGLPPTAIVLLDYQL